MNLFRDAFETKNARVAAVLIVLWFFVVAQPLWAQSALTTGFDGSALGRALEPGSELVPDANSSFRIEKIRVDGGAELLTIFGRLQNTHSASEKSTEIPLISVLRDTLGDANPENDRLRYVWMLSYAK